MSRRGGHLWIFCEQPLLAEQCRVYIYNVALRLGVRLKGAPGLRDGIEIFPRVQRHDQDWLIRGQESGGAVNDIGGMSAFARKTAAPLAGCNR